WPNGSRWSETVGLQGLCWYLGAPNEKELLILSGDEWQTEKRRPRQSAERRDV
ncbi:unnamed protein product, partial [Lampetra planeri]